MLPNIQVVRSAIESMYAGTCTVTVRQEYEKDNGATGFQEVVLFENQPCRLSFSNVTSTKEEKAVATVSQVTKLFLAPEIEIPAGSRIAVTQNGETVHYSKSGVKAKYETHQEIVLQLWERWS